MIFLPKNKGFLNDVIEDQEDNKKVQTDNLNVSLDKTVIEQSIIFDDLVVEPKALRDQTSKDKVLFGYNASLADLRKRGYDRHLRSDEVFRIMIEALENPSDKLNAVADDLWDSHGELLSAYFQVSHDGKELTVFLDPENLKYDSNVYVVDGNNGFIKCSTTNKFSLEKIVKKRIFWRNKTENIPLKDLVRLERVNEINPELVEFLYSRPYHRLPRHIQIHGGLRLPPAGKGGPIGRIRYFTVYAESSYGASRGVRLK